MFDALTHEGPYKAAWSVEEALIEIGAQTGKQFDPMGGGSVPGDRRGALAVPGVEDERALDPRAPWGTASL